MSAATMDTRPARDSREAHLEQAVAELQTRLKRERDRIGGLYMNLFVFGSIFLAAYAASMLFGSIGYGELQSFLLIAGIVALGGGFHYRKAWYGDWKEARRLNDMLKKAGVSESP